MKTATLSSLVVLLGLATGCVTEGIVTEPESPEEAAEANLALGLAYLVEQERPDLAIPLLSRAVEHDPRLARGHYALALAFDQTGDLDLAEQHHRRATQLEPSNPQFQNGSGVFLCRQNRWRDAEPYFRRAIGSANGANPLSWIVNAGNCAADDGDLEAADLYFRQALDIDAAWPDALRGMMDVSIRSGDFGRALPFWQRLDGSGAPIRAEDLLSCYAIEMRAGVATAAEACADRLQREFPGSQALRQLRELQRDAG